MPTNKDKAVIQELAKRVAGIAALPIQEEKRALWRGLNGLKPIRPMVMIEQICWNELNIDNQLTCLCEDDECRHYENSLKQKLYQWEHFPGDMVVETFIPVFKAIRNSGFGVHPQQEVLPTDPSSSVVSHRFTDVLKDDADLNKITVPEVSLDEKETARRMDVAHELFDGILEVRPVGSDAWMQLWDPISAYKGVENALYALVDEPEFMHRMIKKLMLSYTVMLDQLEGKGLLIDAASQTIVHCTGAYTDELPASEYNPDKPRCKDLWTAGLAQMLGSVSSSMYQEFELDYVNPIFERFGLVYYGCCEPLDTKLDIITKIPNLRKVSMSPWTVPERGAEGLGKGFVFSSKPNPAFLATDRFDEEHVKNELRTIKNACDKNGCPLEFILKDISTVRYDVSRLKRWNEIAMEVALG